MKEVNEASDFVIRGRRVERQLAVALLLVAVVGLVALVLVAFDVLSVQFVTGGGRTSSDGSRPISKPAGVVTGFVMVGIYATSVASILRYRVFVEHGALTYCNGFRARSLDSNSVMEVAPFRRGEWVVRVSGRGRGRRLLATARGSEPEVRSLLSQLNEVLVELNERGQAAQRLRDLVADGRERPG